MPTPRILAAQRHHVLIRRRRKATFCGRRLSSLACRCPVVRAAQSPTPSLTGPLRSGLTDLGWLRGVAIMIHEICGDLVVRIRSEYICGLPHRCWMLMVACSFAASVAPTAVSKRISPARVGASAGFRPTRARASDEVTVGVRHRCTHENLQKRTGVVDRCSRGNTGPWRNSPAVVSSFRPRKTRRS